MVETRDYIHCIQLFLHCLKSFEPTEDVQTYNELQDISVYMPHMASASASYLETQVYLQI